MDLDAKKPVFDVCEQQCAIVTRLLESIISKLATSKFSIF